MQHLVRTLRLLAWLAWLVPVAAWAAPTPATIWVPVRPYPSTQTAIPSLSATGAANGGVTKYTVSTAMSTAQGTLYAGGTAITANNTDLTLAQAAALTFVPASGFKGNAFFQYTATDANGTSGAVYYSIPVSSSSCGTLNTNSLDFSTAAQEDWKNHTAVSVSNTTAGTSGYTTKQATTQETINGTAVNPNLFSTTTTPFLLGQTLAWQINSATNDANAATNDVVSVTFTFSRPVNNLALSVQDIDAGTQGNQGSDWVDELQLDGYATTSATSAIGLVAGNVGLGTNNTNTFVNTNTVRGTANNTTADGTVTVTFPSAVQKLVLTYRNTRAYTAGNRRLQDLGITSMSWCAQNDVQATFTSVPSSTTVAAGTTVSYTVQFKNNGVDDATNETRVVTLPAGATNVSAGGGTYNAATNTIDFGTVAAANGNSTSFTYSYLVPQNGGTFSNQAAAGTGATYSSTSPNSGGASAADDSNTGNNVATSSLTVQAVTVSGTIYDDVNYGGGAGRTYTAANSSATASGFASGAIGRTNATVEFYSSDGTYVGSTTTGTGGTYSYNLPSAGTYTVRVVNSSVTPARALNANRTASTGVQTYVNGDANRVGGENPQYTDAAANSGSQTLSALSSGTTTPESIATVSASTTATTGVDFGFNFSTVVNTNTNGQGSLRRFINNANAISNTNLDQDAASTGGTNPAAGVETSIFMISGGQAVPGLRAGLTNQLNSSGVAVISPTANFPLPALTDTYTTIDGTTQTQNVGNTNNVTLGTGGTVGTQATALGQLNGPEVQLLGNTNVAVGLDVASSATNTVIKGLAVLDFGNSTDNDGAANIRSAANNLTITQNVVGTTATSFTAPGTLTNSDNVRLTAGTTNIVVSNNLIGFSNSKGVAIDNGVTNVLLTGNEIRSNGQASSNFDGVDIQGSSAIVTNNLFTGTSGQGIDSYRSSGSNTITNNTVVDNGRGTANLNPTETPGIRIYGAGNTLNQNVVANNYGAGIMLEGTQNNGNPTAVSNTVISQNSIYGNGTVKSLNGLAASGDVGIDLQANGDTEASGTSPYVTLNSTTTTGANGLVNYPVITSAYISGSSLVVSGYAKAGAKIELFTAQPNPTSTNSSTTILASNFGQGSTYLSTVTEGATTGVVDNNSATGQSYSGNINGFNQGSDTNANGFSFSIPLSSLPGGTLAAGTLLTSTATLTTTTNNVTTSVTSEFSGNATAVQALTGYVYEDVNYGGGAGRSRSTLGAAALGRPGAKVELYDASGNYVSTAITDANGQYTFNVPAASYSVRVVNNSVLSSRTGASAASGSATAGYVSTQLAVQTYAGLSTDANAVSRVGGANPAYTDPAANSGSQTLSALSSGTTTPESVATVTVTTSGSNSGPDFGYNFDAIVNTNDSGQGSLRQFVLNSNALGGESSLAQSGSRVDASGTTQALPAAKESSIFMIPDGQAHAGLLANSNGGPASQLTSGVAVITAASALTLTGANAASTIIDATTQTANIGNTNSGTATNTAARTVGTDGLALSAVQKPEVELVGNNIASVIDLEAATETVRGLAVHGGTTQDLLVGSGTASSGYVLENLLVGTTAAGVRPSSNPTGNYGIYLGANAGVGTTQNSLIGFTGNSGIDMANGTGTAGTTQIVSNFIVKTGYTSAGGDGITLGDKGVSGPANIAGNSFSYTNSSGIQFEIGSTSASTVTNNTIDNAGNLDDTGATTSNLEGSGIDYLQRDGSKRGSQNDVLSKNVITNTQASGIVVGYGQQNVTISQNSIYNSGTGGGSKIGIDLIGSNKSVSTGDGVYGVGDGVTVNDGNDPANANATLANRGVDFPVITSAVVGGTNLVVSGYSRPGAVIELFNPGSPANATNFGEGQTYLGTYTEGSSADTDTGTGSYTGTQPDGLNEGADNAANKFTFTIPLTGKFAGITYNSVLSSTATLSNSTSEFSGDVRVTAPPVPNDATNATLADNTSTPVQLSPGLSATAYGNTQNVTTSTANTIAYYTIATLPASGTLYYNGTALTTANIAATQVSDLTKLTYLPAYGNTTTVSFTYTATDANGLASTQHSSSASNGTISNGAATYTIPFSTSADVTASLTGNTTVNSGQPTGYYTATFTNEGPDAASAVTQTVALPSSATLTSAQQTAITNAYPNTTFATSNGVTTITFPQQSTLASGASNSYRFAFTAPTTTGSSTLTASTSTTSSEGTNAAPNSAALSLTTNPVADVQAAIAAGAASYAPGATATFNATFSNNGQAASGVAYTVQLPAGLSSVSAGSGGSYNSTTGLVTYSGAATTLANGGSFTSAITFTMPTNGPVEATASVSTTTAETNTANNVAAASTTAAPSFDLTTTLSGPSTAVAGSPITLFVTTTNNGPQAVSGAVETVQLPTGLTASGTGQNVFVSNGGTYSSSTGVVTFPALGSLPSGQTVGNTITFTVPSNTTIAPSATVTPNTTAAGETNINNNTAYLNGATSSASLTVNGASTTSANVYAILSITSATLPNGTATTATVLPAGSKVTFNAGLGNAGPASASNVQAYMQLLPGLSTSTLTVNNDAGSLSTDSKTITYNNGVVYTIATGLLTYPNTVTLPSGASGTTAVTVTLPATIGNNGQFLATVGVASSNTSDNVPADNVKSVPVAVLPTTDLATTITGPTSGVVAGQPVSYTATFVNNGPSAATNAVETVQLPAGLSTVAVTDASGNTVSSSAYTYSSTTGLVTFSTIASDAVGTNQTYNLAFAAPAQTYTVSSAIGSETTETSPANNAASVTTTTSPTTDVAISVAGPATATAGSQVQYTLTEANNGPNPATGVVGTLQLPAGLSNVTVSNSSGGGSYDASTGLVTLTSASLPVGGSLVTLVSFVMPSSFSTISAVSNTATQLTALATVTSTSTDNVAPNNAAAVVTDLAPTPAGSVDVAAGITPATSTVTAGSSQTLTFNFRNTSTTTAAAYVRPTANLPTGLSASTLTVTAANGTTAQTGTLNANTGLLTFADGSTYDPATGLLTFAPTTSLAANTNLAYGVTFPVPVPTVGNNLLVTSEVATSSNDTGTTNNRATSILTVNPAFDLTTSISGPAAALPGQPVTYAVTSTNSGPTTATSVTQAVTLPTNQTVGTLLVAGQAGTLNTGTGVITYPNGATYTQSSGVLSFAAIASLTPGSSGAVTNSFTLTYPSVTTQTLTANISTTATGETNTNNNSAQVITTQSPLSFAPTADNIVNSLQSVRGNTSTTNLLISPLSAVDPDGSIASYYVQSLPTSGTLYDNGTAITSIPTGGYKVTGSASTLSYKPASGFVGNAFFTYSATDNSGVASNTALYTIPVAQDQSTTYSTYNGSKGGTNKYATNDILTQVIDPNTAVYNGSGIVYNSSTGALQSGAANGLPTSGTNVTQVSGTLPTGVRLNQATGTIFVYDASLLPNNASATTYTVTLQTTDLNGGINTVVETFTLGAFPLPVQLTAFTAQAVQNRDALLKWTTASEVNNDHFELERSLDGTSFVKIGQQQGQGNKASATDYTFTDAGIGPKVTAGQPVYYRLKQLDLDGTSTYSPVRTVSFSGPVAAVATLYPNPAATATGLDLSALPAANTYRVLLVDAAGRQVRQLTLAGGQVQPLDLGDLASGTYSVLVAGQQADGSALRQVLRLIKE